LFRKGIIVIVVLLFPVLCHCQVSREKKALKYIHKHRYHSAYVLLKKALARDSANAATKFVLAQYFMQPKNADYHLDSAYIYSRKALSSWAHASARERSRLRRLPVDSVMLTSLRSQIETQAFEEVRRVNTKEAFDRFLSLYANKKLQGAAIELRDKVTFDAALAENTPTAFYEYMRAYPSSRFVPEAKTKYDYLTFQEATREKTLEQYEEFFKGHPHSPYRPDAERQIFEIMTADGSPESFSTFLGQYPNSYFRKRATDIVYHILSEDRRKELFPSLFSSDSLVRAAEVEETFLVPFLVRGKFGFMDHLGKEVIAPALDDISDEYICGNVAEDLLAIPGKIISKDGATIFPGNVMSMDDLGYGFLLIELESGNRVLHKSGFQFTDSSIEDAKVIGGRLIGVKKNGLWGVFTLHGRKLLPYQFQQVDAIGNVVVLKAQDQYSLSTVSSLAGIANNRKGRFTEAFDEVKKISSDKIFIRLKNFEGILDQKLEILVKMDTHRLAPVFFGALSYSGRGVSIFNEYGEESEYFEQVQVVNPWVAAKNKSGWMLYDPVHRISKSVFYDSISIHGPFAVGVRIDGIEIHVHKSTNHIVLPPQDKIEFLPSHDSLMHLALQKDNKWSVYSTNGEKLFTAAYDKIQAAGSGFFIVSKKEKKGLLNSQGKLVLGVEYDAIGMATNGTISVLKSMKFGLFNYLTGTLIRPEYEKNIIAFNEKIFSVFREGLWGFVDDKNKPVSKIEFQEIMPWTDSLALVRSSGGWALFNVFTREAEMENIRNFKVIRSSPHDRLIIVKQGEDVGVLSNRNGFIIPLKFSDIVNVGSSEIPVYFTEKHVQEASIFVVIYYDNKGRLIRKEVYEQDEYERIYCNGNKEH
jgi:hypothetical protein